MGKRAPLYAVWLTLLCLQCGTPPPDADAMLASACRFLWSRQGEDGGWHSETHGLLRGGQAWTPFILHALVEAPEAGCLRPLGAVERALDFIRRHTNAEGVLGLADPDVLEYPNYATAYALRVLVRQDDGGDASLVERMTGYLRGQQFDEQRGVGPAEAAYGSWGFGEVRLPPGRTGHVDLSHTRRVLQALRAAGHADAETYRKAEAFLALVQKHPHDARIRAAGGDSAAYDGGFFASPVVPGVNKSAPVPGGRAGPATFGSYATATADGLLALLASGAAPDDARVQDAARWLHSHPALDFPEGIPQDDPAQWHRVLFFYHLSTRAEAYAAAGWPVGGPAAMVRALAGRQHPGGRFANPDGALNKEDDPLLATAMAVQILSHALKALENAASADAYRR